MTVDETELVFECRACGRQKDTRKKLVQHINSKNDSKHRGRDTEDLIMRVYPSVLPSEPSWDNYKRIIEAFDRIKSGKVEGLGPGIGEEEIQEVCELADEPKDKVIRLLEDEGFSFRSAGRPPTNHFDQLSDKRQAALAWHYNNPGLTQSEIAERVGLKSSSTVSSALSEKGWLLEDRFKPDEIDNWFKKSEDADEIIDNAVEHGLIQTSDNGDVEEDSIEEGEVNESQKDTEENTEANLSLQNGELELVLSGEDEVFGHIAGLIKLDEYEKAKEHFHHIIHN